MCRIPGLFKQASLVICHPDSAGKEDVERIMLQTQAFRSEMLQCRTRIENVFPTALKSRNERDLVYELLATCLVALAMANRLLTALGSPEGPSLEKEVLVDAAGVIKLESDMISTSGWAGYYLNQKATVASGFLSSSGTMENKPGHIIETWRFHEWCRAMQRDCCCYKF